MQEIYKRIAGLLSVKSIVTVILTVIFAYLAITEKVNQDFLTIYTVVIAFYYGTQATAIKNKEGSTHE